MVALVLIFVVVYAAIALEHPLNVSKSATALFGAGLLWTVYALLSGDHLQVGHQLNESLASTAQIVFFPNVEFIGTVRELLQVVRSIRNDKRFLECRLHKSKRVVG